MRHHRAAQWVEPPRSGSRPELTPDEARWPERISAGDDATFDAMFTAYAAPLRVFAEGYLHSADEAADVVQDMFLALWHGRRTWVCRGSVRAYLYAGVRNRALNRLRSGRARERVTDALGREAVLVETPAGVDNDAADPMAMRLALCERALAALPEKYRQVLLLRWDHELTYAEIAAVLDVPIKTVNTRMTRALKRMRQFCLP